jgi:hypothetical protein
LLTIWREAAARAVDAVCLTVDQRWVKDSWLPQVLFTCAVLCGSTARSASKESFLWTQSVLRWQLIQPADRHVQAFPATILDAVDAAVD